MASGRSITGCLVDDRLTRRQRDVLDFLQANAHRFARPPTLDELCDAMGLASRGSLHKHVRALVEAGWIEPLAGRQRGVRLARAAAARSPPAPAEAIPFLGVIAAGRPIEALPGIETIEVPPHLRTQRPCYVLQVRGDSMIDAGILDGDRIVIEQRDAARNGEIVVALVDGHEATLKRIEQQPGRVVLHAANPAYSPIEVEPGRVQVQGRLVGLMRGYGRR